MRQRGKGRIAVLERLRAGPLPSSEAASVTTNRATLKVLIHHLRAAGFVIEASPDPARGGQQSRAVIYTLSAEPSAEQPKGLS